MARPNRPHCSICRRYAVRQGSRQYFCADHAPADARPLKLVSRWRLCKHCRTRWKVGRTGGLCLTCFRKPAVAALHPADGVRPAEVVGGWNPPGALPAEPTLAPPGTAEKEAVMRERAARREALHHPLDARGDGGRAWTYLVAAAWDAMRRNRKRA